VVVVVVDDLEMLIKFDVRRSDGEISGVESHVA
jgi:hypothetical protein